MIPPRRPIRDYMTPLPHVIGVEQTLATASRRMTQLGIRHLPVVDEGRLVGIVSERDIAHVLSLRSVDPSRAVVEEAMTPEPYEVSPETPLSVVARKMAERRVGSVIVVEDGEVVGLLTSTDALGLLADLLTGFLGTQAEDRLPSEVRKRILAEHEVLKDLLTRTEVDAQGALEGDTAAQEKLAYRARELYQMLLRHVDLEDEILAPALREHGARGRQLADALEAEHRGQRAEMHRALALLDTAQSGPAELARSLSELVPRVLTDMADEEDKLLSDKLLKDDSVSVDLFTG